MSEIMTNDIRVQYKKAFSTIRSIVEAFPEDRWREPHGDVYYIPCRIAYHLAVVIYYYFTGLYKDKDYVAKLPYGRWIEARAEDLPDKTGFLIYLDGAIDKAGEALAVLRDEDLALPAEPEIAWTGAGKIGMYLYVLRELSDHTGELNKMLIEDGQQDVWFAK